MKTKALLPLFISIAALFLVIAISRSHSAKEDAQPATEKNVPTLLELGSVGCSACAKMEPVLESVKEAYTTKANVVFHDVRKNPDIARKYGIRVIPTQIFLNADGTEAFRHEGFFPEAEIANVFAGMGITP